MSADTILVKRDFYCAKCGNGFSKGSSWKKHMMNQHGKRADFECENCKKEFGRKYELKDQTLSGNGDIFCVRNVRVYLSVGEE